MKTFAELKDLRKLLQRIKKQLKKVILASINQKKKQENKDHHERKNRDKRISDVGGLCDKVGYRHIIEQDENLILGILLASMLKYERSQNQEQYEAMLETLGKNTFESFKEEKSESVPRDQTTYQMGALCEKIGLDILASNGKRRFVLGLLKKGHDDYLSCCNDDIKKKLSLLGMEAFNHTEETQTRFIDLTYFANKQIPI